MEIEIVVADILLTENSTNGYFQTTFKAQKVKIKHKKPTVIQGVDGYISIGNHLSEVVWLNGRASSLQNVTHIKIIRDNGNVLIDGELNTFHSNPQDIDNDVFFYVLTENEIFSSHGK